MHLFPEYPVRTARLALRPLRPTDDEALWSYLSLEEVCRFVPFGPYDLGQVRERLANQYSRRDLTEEGQVLVLGLTVAPEDDVVGHVMLRWLSAAHRDGEIGWMLHPAACGHGYAQEAMGAVLQLAFDGLGLHRCIARIDERNAPSIAVAERLGMRREAHLVENLLVRGEWCGEVDYALLDREWRERAAHTG